MSVEETEQCAVVAVGASAGGVQALAALASGCPPDARFALVVVLHMPSSGTSALASILARSGPFRAVSAQNGTLVEAGTAYVARPNQHLMLRDGRVYLTGGPTENGHRPAINALFRSVALARGHRGIGVLLSGVLDDGVAGLAAIKSRGGRTIVQDPEDAMFPTMPENALAAGVVDHVERAGRIGSLLEKLVEEDLEGTTMEADPRLELENRIAFGARFATHFNVESLGPPSGYMCPDCNGSLMDVGGETFRCRVGHAWTAESLLNRQSSEIEGALWVALRSLEEKAKLSRTLAARSNEVRSLLRQRYLQTEAEANHAADILRNYLSRIYETEGAESGVDVREQGETAY